MKIILFTLLYTFYVFVIVFFFPGVVVIQEQHEFHNICIS